MSGREREETQQLCSDQGKEDTSHVGDHNNNNNNA